MNSSHPSRHSHQLGQVAPKPLSDSLETGLLVMYIILFAASLFPIWSVRYHPLPDLGNHMAAVSVWAHFNDQAYDFHRYYDVRLGLNPYWGYYGPMRVLIPLVGIDIANRIVLSVYVLMLPLGMAWLGGRLGRSPWLALGAFPFLWTFSFNHGFIQTSLGLALVPSAIAAFDWLCERPTTRHAMLAVLLGITVYFCHIVPFLLYLGCAGAIGILHRDRSTSRLLWRATAWSGACCVAILVSVFGSGKGMGRSPDSYSFSWDMHPLDLFRHIYDWTWENCAGREAQFLALLLGLGWLALAVTAQYRRGHGLHDYRGAACVAVAVAGYVLLPKSVLTPVLSWGVKYRLAAWALLFLWLLIPGPITGWRRWLMTPVILAGGGFAVDTTLHWRAANRPSDGFDDVAMTLPHGSRVLFITELLSDSSDRLEQPQNWAAFQAAYRGGYDPWLFDDFPIKFRVHYPAPLWRTMAFSWWAHARFYDYVVALRKNGTRIFGEHLAQVELVKSSGDWDVWKLPGPRIDEPPPPQVTPEEGHDRWPARER